MKWMRWGPDDYDSAYPEDTREIVALMGEEQQRIEEMGNK